ncbi:PREDICTED: OCIA domain-containing protein 1-like [Trachymyrmex septentrionalis]|uniref:OCIA domain-containing protein 1-like n=1 Tax=Trachymyrmex septentrionalis TaxID=34720 RepID=UPI00084ED981|nr:PREDICTED: OCIA domain-containing protein 1-like [Trachymyrmex septentrionalis]
MSRAVITDVQQPDPKYRRQQEMYLTPEEMRAMRQCVKNSSSLAPTIISAAIGYGICKMTPFHANAKYVALASSVIGMIMSRLSAVNSCMIKVASMPDSHNLREKMRQVGYLGNVSPYREALYYQGPQSEVQSPAESSAEIQFDDYPPMNSYDTYSSINPDNSDFNVSEDTDLSKSINIQKEVSYEELRHQNRDEFYKKHKQYTPKTRELPVTKETSEQVPTTSSRSPMQKETKYGDVWD